MSHTIITSYINLLLIAINILIGFYNFQNNQKSTIFNPMANNIIEKVFVPFQQKIGHYIFKTITDDNIKIIHKNLIELHNVIDNNIFEFALSHQTITSLNLLIKFTPVNKKDFKKYNKLFQIFSYFYFKDTNKFRKKAGLPQYNNEYRISLKLYKNLFWVVKYYAKVTYTIIIISIILKFITNLF